MGKTIRPYTHTCRIQFLIYFFLILFISDYAVSQEGIAVPENPRIPDVVVPGIDDVKDISVLKVKIRFNIYGRGEEQHKMIVPESLSEFEINSEDSGGVKKINFKDLAGFEIKEWAGIPDKSGAYIFYPDKYVLTLKSGEKINAEKNISLFNVISIESDGNVKFLYSYFYDYYRKGVWINRGVKSPEPVSKVPVKGCVTEIKLN